MNNNTFRIAMSMVVGAMLSAAAVVGAAGPSQTRAPRGQLVHDIVLKWGVDVQKTYHADVHRWADAMGPVFAGAPLEVLSRAKQAKTFAEMNNVLLSGRSEKPADVRAEALKANTTLASAPKVLGDAANDLVFVPVTPCRVIDTRVAGGAITANTVRNFQITETATYVSQGGNASDCNGVGSAGAFAAAVLNITVTATAANGYITAFPYLAAQPLASNLNYVAGQTVPNLVIVKLNQAAGSGSDLSIYSFAQTHLVADIVGYFINPQATNLNCVNTTVQSFQIAANSTNFFNNLTCPTGYTAVTPYCWTASSGVYSQGSGYNANSAANPTFCAWQNTTGVSQTVFGGNICCRVPGR